ncbi:MAG: DMT family transporter [Rhodobacteraceae bacterium]|nr:DMT family transporter [Paracoccaceae bacterium]
MRLILLTGLTMVAFAANSIFNRLAVDSGAAAPLDFAVLRVVSGAVALIALVLWQRRDLTLWRAPRLLGAGALTVYLVGFSLAYLTLDAGLGALILFAVVQMTMLALSALRGARATLRQGIGAAIALAGLAWVLWPEPDAPMAVAGAALMALAGLGWGIYTMIGRGEADPLAATAANFLLAVPLVAAVALWAGADPAQVTPAGYALAIASGALTSGMGYALWYSVLPRIDASLAATVQLSVPVIALVLGALLLGEAVAARALVGVSLVIGGIFLTLRKSA